MHVRLAFDVVVTLTKSFPDYNFFYYAIKVTNTKLFFCSMFTENVLS